MTASKRACPEKSVGTLLIALAGPPMIWALHFGLVYGMQPVFCVLLGGGRAGAWAQTAAIAATVAALLALGFIVANPAVVRRIERTGPSGPFLTGAMRWLALLSFVGVLWAGGAALFFTACESFV